MPDLIAGLEWLRAPEFLLLVMQFLYRYLIVLMDEASAMRQASVARAGSIRDPSVSSGCGGCGSSVRAVVGARAGIHQAMISRGFEGRIPAFRQ